MHPKFLEVAAEKERRELRELMLDSDVCTVVDSLPTLDEDRKTRIARIFMSRNPPTEPMAASASRQIPQSVEIEERKAA